MADLRPTDERRARARRAYAAVSQAVPEGVSSLRVADLERQTVVSELQRHYVAGRLDSDELSERLGQAWAARTVSQLRMPLRDLPAHGTNVQEMPRPHLNLTRLPGLVLLGMVALMVLSWLIWLPGLRF